MRNLFLAFLMLFFATDVHAQDIGESDVVDAKPTFRVPPVMPFNATTSGYCCMRFSVSQIGKPEDVESYYCTDPVLDAPAVAAVEKWKYEPKTIGGQAVVRSGMETLMTFFLTDNNDLIIRSPDGFPLIEQKNGQMTPVRQGPDELCSAGIV